MNRISSFKLLLITPIFILLSHYLAVFPHEYAHSFMAWALGFKSNPLALIYGGTSWPNLLFLANIDENVDYKTIFYSGHHTAVAAIAFAGPGIANGLLFILSFILLRNKKVQQHPYWFYFLFWFNLMNLGNFYDYVPIRTFASHGDVFNFMMGLNISPWWIYSIGGYLVAFLMWQFFTKTLPLAYNHLKLTSTLSKASLMIACVCFLFYFFGGSGTKSYGVVSYIFSMTSLLAIPGIILILWPRKR